MWCSAARDIDGCIRFLGDGAVLLKPPKNTLQKRHTQMANMPSQERGEAHLKTPGTLLVKKLTESHGIFQQLLLSFAPLCWLGRRALAHFGCITPWLRRIRRELYFRMAR